MACSNACSDWLAEFNAEKRLPMAHHPLRSPSTLSFLTSVKGAACPRSVYPPRRDRTASSQPESILSAPAKKAASTATSLCSSSTPAANFDVRFGAVLAQDGGHATKLNFDVPQQRGGFIGRFGRRLGEQPLHLAHADAGGLQAFPGVAVRRWHSPYRCWRRPLSSREMRVDQRAADFLGIGLVLIALHQRLEFLDAGRARR